MEQFALGTVEEPARVGVEGPVLVAFVLGTVAFMFLYIHYGKISK